MDKQSRILWWVAVALLAVKPIVDVIRRGETRGLVVLAVFAAVLAVNWWILGPIVRATASHGKRFLLLALGLAVVTGPLVATFYYGPGTGAVMVVALSVLLAVGLYYRREARR